MLKKRHISAFKAQYHIIIIAIIIQLWKVGVMGAIVIITSLGMAKKSGTVQPKMLSLSRSLPPSLLLKAASSALEHEYLYKREK